MTTEPSGQPQTQESPSWSIGLIGFSYPEWSTTLYAGDSRSFARRGRHLLSRYAAFFNAVEINTTFYGIPSPDTVRAWADATPADFRFCVKVPRDVTHGPTPPGALAAAGGPPPGHLLHERTLATSHRFMEAMQPLGRKLASVLLQFPPRFAANRRDELAAYFDRLDRAIPLAVELRHDSWWASETKAILHASGVCWVGTDESPRQEAERAPDLNGLDKDEPWPMIPTTDFLYVRWLGKHGQFNNRSREHIDPSSRLGWWAKRLHNVLHENRGLRAVYGFFDNDFAGHAPTTAQRFMSLLGLLPPGPLLQEHKQPTLFG